MVFFASFRQILGNGSRPHRFTHFTEIRLRYFSYIVICEVAGWQEH
jgi:hypothetical protein